MRGQGGANRARSEKKSKSIQGASLRGRHTPPATLAQETKIARVCSVRYRYGCRTELTEVSCTGIDVVPNIPKCTVPVLMYRNYRSVRYRYPYTELTDVSGTGMDFVPTLPKCPVPVLMSPNLPKCPVPVLMPYRTYRSVRYRY